VRLWSHVQANRIMEGIVEFKGKSEREIAQAIAATAGASAEQFGEQYGDTIDPSQAAKVALDQFRRLLDQWERKK
jgi:hypothetical protein